MLIVIVLFVLCFDYLGILGLIGGFCFVCVFGRVVCVWFCFVLVYLIV